MSSHSWSLGGNLNYCQAVPFLAICAPSLAQLIHAPIPAPSLITVASLSFDWNSPLQITYCASLACDLAMASMWIMHNHGCPLWPLVPSSEYGAFLALLPTSPSQPIIVGSSDTSYFGWAFQFQTSSDKPPVLIVGSFRTLSELVQPLMLLARRPIWGSRYSSSSRSPCTSFWNSSHGLPCSFITTSNPSQQLLQSSAGSLLSWQLPLYCTSRYCHSVSTAYAGNSCHPTGTITVTVSVKRRVLCMAEYSTVFYISVM